MRPVFRASSPGLHILALHAVVVAAPLFDVLRRNREFFVAYRAATLDLLLLVAIVSLLLPLALVLLIQLASVASGRLARAMTIGGIGALSAALGSQAIARLALDALPHAGASLAIGAAGAALYALVPAVRVFLTFLSPAIVIVPAVLLLHPAMRPFVWPDDPGARAAADVKSGTPIVLVVFDQLPLTSLLTADGRIDAVHYPGFAALASGATWYRQASTVADLTGWALPAIVSGRYPRPGRLPITEDYPENLFTFLARSHRMEVFEPITRLCPRPVCESEREPLLSRVGGMLLDSAVVYAYVIAPPSLASSLPPLTENWRGFIDAQRWQQRWISERDADRRDAPNAFLAGIERADPQPTLYFLHALLPHEPYMYLPSGQRFTDRPRLFGLQPNGRWVNDLWPVSQAYATELVQVGYVDRFVARLVARLRDQGLYDRALLIVTADHGVSFRPGLTFKGVNNTTVRDIAPVPLIVKHPFQQQGAVSDRNVQSIDIVPLVADVLGTPLTWESQGISPVGEAAPPAVKTVFHSGAARRVRLTPAALRAGGEAVNRRVGLLGGEDIEFRTPRIAPHPHLIGRSVESLRAPEETTLRVAVDEARQWMSVDPEGELIPSLVSGRITDERHQPASAILAVAVNGRIEATTKTYDTVPGYEGFWSALLDPHLLREGRNTIDVFVIRGESGTEISRGFSSVPRPLASINLVSEEAQAPVESDLTGFYAVEGAPGPRFRWTSGDATISWTFPGEERPRSLRLGLASVARAAHLRVSYNGCAVLDANVPAGAWRRTVSLDGCPAAAREASKAEIHIASPTFTGPRTDPRTLGVPIETLRLSPEPWPLPAAADDTRGRVVAVEPAAAREGTILRPGAAVLLEITNLGTRAWASAVEASTSRPVRIVPMWRAPDGGAIEGAPVDLPQVLYPTDRVQLWARLDPPAAIRRPRAGTVDVSLELLEGGRPIDLAEPGAPRVRVSFQQE